MQKTADKKRKTATCPDEHGEICLLEKISAMAARRKKVSEIIAETLAQLSRQLCFARATITLRNGDYLFIEDADGLDRESIKRGVYKMGEGVTGKAAAENRPIVVADIAKCKEFLNKTKSHTGAMENVSFICVPIVYMEQVIGTLSAERTFADKKRLAADLDLLETIANIIADPVALIYMRKEERNKMLAEYRRNDGATGAGKPAAMVGNCGAMQNVYDFIGKAAACGDPVFIRGKSGTGKELAAREIARMSAPENEFKVVNCAAVQASAHLSKLCLDKPATVFFDEIAALPRRLQKALAEALNTRTVFRLGESTPRRLRARIICASCQDVESLLANDAFEKPLYDAISKLSAHIPSLKDRKSDIVLLAEHFLEKFNAIHSKNIKRISTPAINMMSIYSWPGNVRELENCIERAVMSSQDSAISGYNLPPAVRASYTRRALPYGEDTDYNSMVESFERELITEALKISRGNAAKAARHLGLTQRIINYKIKQYAISAGWFKNTK